MSRVPESGERVYVCVRGREGGREGETHTEKGVSEFWSKVSNENQV